jgi:hypothetical protein
LRYRESLRPGNARRCPWNSHRVPWQADAPSAGRVSSTSSPPKAHFT